MQHTPGYGNEASIVEINTTPLIDVLLVLLIMFIVTVPLQTHAVKLDLPGQPPIPTSLDPVRNKVVITSGGQILWNGVATTTDGLRYNLALTQELDPAPELHLQPEPDARYELVDEVLAISKRAGVGNMGFVGNERYAAL